MGGVAQGEGVVQEMKTRASFALGFLLMIAVGAALLMCPFMRADARPGNASAAFFTACSAVCVTGLSVVDIAKEYSTAGQVAIMVLVELGCLGLMTCGTFFLVAIGRRISLSREFTLMNAYGVEQVHGLRGLIIWIVMSMLVIEAAFAAALYFHFGSWYESVFYSIMSFCNAGFGLEADSLATFPRSWPVVLMGVETILGGMGFLVIYNLCTFKFLHRTSGARGRLSLHTRVVLRFTAYLLALAFVAFLAVEWGRALAGMDLADKLVVGFYQAVTPRTCGFTVVPTEALHPLTRLVYECLMFMGGAPGSAAAGMKVTTLAVILYTATAMCRGETETVIDRRTIPTEIVRESLVILMAIVVFAVVVAGALFVTEAGRGATPEALFFEAVSAVTTTGLSVGDTTASLSQAGRIVIMVAMFIGRLGALTVVLMIGDRESKRHVRFPTEELVVG